VLLAVAIGIVLASVTAGALVLTGLDGQPMSFGQLLPPITVSGNDLWKEYCEGTGSKYTDRTVVVTGVTLYISGKDERGRSFFEWAYAARGPRKRSGGARIGSFADFQQNLYQGSLSLKDGIVLFIDEKDLHSFDGLPRDKPITVRGICRGKQPDPKTDPDFFIQVDDCTLVK
jgi:hypothetical protein